MKIEVKLFARAKEVAGTESVEVEVPEPARVSDVRRALIERFPDLQALAPKLLVSVGSEYATDQTPISQEAQVACFPPVSGG